MTMHHKHPSLPPLSLENCSLRNSNSSFHTSTLNYDNYTYFEVNDGIWTKNNWTQTTEVMPDAKNQVVSYRELVVWHGSRVLQWHCIVLYLYIYLELLAVHSNQKRSSARDPERRERCTRLQSHSSTLTTFSRDLHALSELVLFLKCTISSNAIQNIRAHFLIALLLIRFNTFSC